MSSSVEIYVKYPGNEMALAHRIAIALGATGYFYSGEGSVYTLDAKRWIGADGRGSLDLALTDLGRHGDPGFFAGSAFAPYEYELSLEFRGGVGISRGELQERFGRVLFERLTELELPLAFGDSECVFADYLPHRGIREFPPDTDYDEPGRGRWFESRLHADSAISWPISGESEKRGAPSHVTVFETDGLVQFVSQSVHDHGRESVPPVVSLRTSAGTAAIGQAFTQAVWHSPAEPAGGSDPNSWLVGTSRLSADEFSRRAISIDVEADVNSIIAVPHASYEGKQVNTVVLGPAIDQLAYHRAIPQGDEAVGELIVRLVTAARDHSHV